MLGTFLRGRSDMLKILIHKKRILKIHESDNPQAYIILATHYSWFLEYTQKEINISVKKIFICFIPCNIKGMWYLRNYKIYIGKLFSIVKTKNSLSASVSIISSPLFPKILCILDTKMKKIDQIVHMNLLFFSSITCP